MNSWMGYQCNSKSKPMADFNGWCLRKMRVQDFCTRCSLLGLDLKTPLQSSDVSNRTRVYHTVANRKVQLSTMQYKFSQQDRQIELIHDISDVLGRQPFSNSKSAQLTETGNASCNKHSLGVYTQDTVQLWDWNYTDNLRTTYQESKKPIHQLHITF